MAVLNLALCWCFLRISTLASSTKVFSIREWRESTASNGSRSWTNTNLSNASSNPLCASLKSESKVRVYAACSSDTKILQNTIADILQMKLLYEFIST